MTAIHELEETFNASVGWFYRVKNQVQLHNVKAVRKAVSKNEDAGSTLKNNRRL
jgi:hypothetical protein